MVTTHPTIVAYASEDNRYDYVRQRAIETAKSEHARLILYDIDAAGIQSPLPTVWSAGGTMEQFRDGVLTQEQLEAAGRHGLAVQVQECLDRGVETYGWLPGRRSVTALADYAEKQGASLVMVPAHAERATLLDRIRHRSIQHLDAQTRRPVAIVQEDGAVAMSD